MLMNSAIEHYLKDLEAKDLIEIARALIALDCDVPLIIEQEIVKRKHTP